MAWAGALSDLKQLIRERRSIAEFLYRDVGEVEVQIAERQGR